MVANLVSRRDPTKGLACGSAVLLLCANAHSHLRVQERHKAPVCGASVRKLIARGPRWFSSRARRRHPPGGGCVCEIFRTHPNPRAARGLLLAAWRWAGYPPCCWAWRMSCTQPPAHLRAGKRRGAVHNTRSKVGGLLRWLFCAWSCHTQQRPPARSCCLAHACQVSGF